MNYNKDECKGCFYAEASPGRCILKEPKRETRCRTVWKEEKGHYSLTQEPRLTKVYYSCEICNEVFECDPFEHIEDSHYDDPRCMGSERQIDFESRYISEVD